MLRVALTGGIGSGKSTVADLFAKLGVYIVDTDVISRDLTMPGTKQYDEILNIFGNEVIGPDERLSRDKLREKVFKDDDARGRLEAILHPAIRLETRRRVKLASSPYVIIVVPLLVEVGGYDCANRTLVVDCDPQLQIDRVMKRSGLTRSQVEAIMATQATRDARRAQADDLLLNEGGLETLTLQVAQLHRRYLDMSKEVR